MKVERGGRIVAMPPEASAELSHTYRTLPLGPGTSLHVLETGKWKTVFVDVFVRRELDEHASEFAILPQVLKRGTSRAPDLRAMTRRLEELYGATLGSEILKIGELQVMLVRLEIVNAKYVPGAPRILEDGLDLLCDLLFDPRIEAGGFVPSFVEQEKRNLVRTIEGLLNDKTAYASERCCQEMCAGEPFGLYEYGRVEDVRAIAPRRLYEFYRESFDRCPIDVFVAGDIEFERACELFSARLSPRRRGDLAPRVALPHPRARPVREVIEKRQVKQGKLVLGLRSEITARDDRFPALLFANGVLGAFPHSKLFRVVREREGLCYYASSSLEKTKGVMIVSSGIEPVHYARARSLIEAQIDAVRAADLTEEEIEKTRKALSRGLRTIADSASRTAVHWYTGLLNGRPSPLSATLQAVERVSAAEVAEAARATYLDTVYFLTAERVAEAGPPGARKTSERRAEEAAA